MVRVAPRTQTLCPPLVCLLVALLVTYVVRVALTVILIAGAPLALMGHALPQTDGIARWWWKAFGGVLAIQIAQSLALVTAIRLFLRDRSPPRQSPAGRRPLKRAQRLPDRRPTDQPRHRPGQEDHRTQAPHRHRDARPPAGRDRHRRRHPRLSRRHPAPTASPHTTRPSPKPGPTTATRPKPSNTPPVSAPTSKSSSATPQPPASTSSPAAASSNPPSAGSCTTAAWPATTKPTPPLSRNDPTRRHQPHDQPPHLRDQPQLAPLLSQMKQTSANQTLTWMTLPSRVVGCVWNGEAWRSIGLGRLVGVLPASGAQTLNTSPLIVDDPGLQRSHGSVQIRCHKRSGAALSWCP